MKKSAAKTLSYHPFRPDLGERLQKIPPTIRSLILIAILLVVVFATFKSLCDSEFAGFDDRLTLYKNPRLHPAPPESVFHSALWYWNHAEYSLYIPVTYQVWAVLTQFAHVDKPGPVDLDPAVFHTANVCLHLLTVTAVFLLLRLLVQRDWAAAVGALAYGLHPLQVEPVAWASGLKDLLSGLWVMLALWQYLLYASSPSGKTNNAHPPSSRGGDFSRHLDRETTGDGEKFPRHRLKPLWLHYALALLFLALAMLSKPSAMMMPFIAALLDWGVIGRSPLRVIVSAIPLFIVIAPLVIVAKLVQAGSPVDVVALWQRPFIATDALAFYLGKLAVPIHLAACYARRPAVVIQHGWLWWTWLVPAAVACAVLIFRRSRRWLIAAAGVMLVALAPVLGLTAFDYQRISTVADHYMYVAMLGPALALAFALSRARPGWPRRIAIAATALLLLFFAGASAVQTTYWHDALSLWSHAVDVAPESHTAHLNLGTTYDHLGPQMLPAAYHEFARAVELNPNDFNAQDNLAGALVRLGHPDEALDHMKRAIQVQDQIGVDPASPMYQAQIGNRIDLGDAFLSRGRFADAAELYQDALRLDPRSSRAMEGLRRARGQAPATRPAPK